MFCKSRLEILEKVLRVILQITQSHRRGKESYEAIPLRSSCRQDHLPNNEVDVKDVKSFDSEIFVTLGCHDLSRHLRILMFSSSLSKVFQGS